MTSPQTAFQVQALPRSAPPAWIAAMMGPAGQVPPSYTLRFASPPAPNGGLGAPLQVGTYSRADGQSANAPGQPILEYDWGDIGCDEYHGMFEITALSVAGVELQELTIAFETLCDNSPNLYVGCLHLENVEIAP